MLRYVIVVVLANYKKRRCLPKLMGLVGRWWQYLNERFPPFSYPPMIIALFFSGYLLGRRELAGDFLIISGIITVFLVMFRLRLFDELKDLDVDANLHPDRPVQRGLVKLGELKILAIAALFAEIALNLAIGGWIFFAYLLVLLYSLLMFVEFFIGGILRRDILAYAVPHVAIMPLLGFYSYSFAAGPKELVVQPVLLFYFALCYVLGLLFEVSRKMHSNEEVKSRLNSFTVQYGRHGAWLLMGMLLAAACAILGLLTIALAALPVFALFASAFGLFIVVFAIVRGFSVKSSVAGRLGGIFILVCLLVVIAVAVE